MCDMNTAVSEFLVESEEVLIQLEHDIIDLKDKSDQRILSRMFRAIRTIKGSSMFLGFAKLESLAHRSEALLSEIDNGDLILSLEMKNVLVNMVEAFRHMFTCIERDGADGEQDYLDLKAQLTAVQLGKSVAAELPEANHEACSRHHQDFSASIATNAHYGDRVREDVVAESDLYEAVAEFLEESMENLMQVERNLMNLEQTPEERTLSNIFTTIHTIKGTCAFLGYESLESLATSAETLLCRIRDGEVVLTSCRKDALLNMVDAIRKMLESIKQNRDDGSDDYSQLKAQLTALSQNSAGIQSMKWGQAVFSNFTDLKTVPRPAWVGI